MVAILLVWAQQRVGEVWELAGGDVGVGGGVWGGKGSGGLGVGLGHDGGGGSGRRRGGGEMAGEGRAVEGCVCVGHDDGGGCGGEV